MIRIQFHPPDTPEWEKWHSDCAREQNKLNEAVARGEAVKVNSQLYGRLKEYVYLSKLGPFHGKCAFCEEYIRSAQHGDIEHFRPKGAIKDLDNRPIEVLLGVAHPGYYWLAYVWQNLLASCQLCNQPSTARSETRIGKWNFFPLTDEAHRAKKPGEEANEAPLLLNPMWDDPSQHLGIDLTGVMFPYNGSARGQACIEIFGLNERDLPDQRKNAIRDSQRLFRDWVDSYIDDPTSNKTIELKTELQQIEDGVLEFSAARRVAVEEIRKRLRQVLP